FIFDNTTDPVTAVLSYPAATLDPSQASLTVREREQDPRIALPSSAWTYLSPTQIQISRSPELDAGAIYEFIYPARDPIVMGLGFAAMRDVVSFLRWQSRDDRGNPNPLNIEGAPGIQQVYAFGSSQSGRYLRDMLWQGFMEDEDGRRVFDGIIAHKAGSRKTFTNFEFSQPGRFSRQHEDHLYGGDQFPFTYESRFDSISEKTDGLLARCRDSSTCPKIMHTDTGTEPWQARSSLVVVDELGSDDIPLPTNVRAYYFSSTQHGPALMPELGICQQLSNPAPFSPALRALLVALDRWVPYGFRPPASRFPRIDDGTLVPSLPQSEQGFPEIPGVTYDGLVNELSELDTSVQPPAPIPGRDYVVLVPKVDADGNDLAGIRLPGIEAPLATFTGWNLRRGGVGRGGAFLPTIPLSSPDPQ